MKTITITRGLEAIVDDADYVRLVGFKWFAAIANGHTYAARTLQARGGGQRMVLMHRVLLGEPDGIVRHINGDGLDNRRENLRLVPRKVKEPS